MIHIDIYLENTEKYVKKKQGWYGYVLTYQGREFHIADGYRKVEDTRNGNLLPVLAAGRISYRHV